MEASVISAARTAASAVLAFETLGAGRLPPRPKIGFVGCGVIARNIAEMIGARGHSGAFAAYDLRDGDAQRLLRHVHAPGPPARSVEEVVRGSDVVIFATSAGSPHVRNPDWFAHGPVVLNISLRDLSPEIVLVSDNVVDDVDHCLQADTSPHLAERQVGHRNFINGTLADALRSNIELTPDRPVIFSPFGMGILDLAVGRHVYETARRAGQMIEVPNFFSERARW
jgi:ornithine cyclodeaminase